MNKLKINDYVKIIDSNIYGIVVSIQKNKITFKTLDGKIITCQSDKLEKNKIPKTKNIKININFKNNTNNIFKNEIMLRHMNKEEALITLEKFISDAILNKEKKIKIIHGKHGGILREAVHEYLSSSPFIEKFELAGYFEGQYGVTIAYLKK